MGLEGAGSLANLYLAGAGVNAAAGAANSYAQSNAMRAQGQHVRQSAEDDALMRELQAKDVERAGGKAAAMKGKETSALIARQRAAAAGQGVDVGSQSVADLGADAAMFGAMDVETIDNNSWKTAWGMRAEAAQTRRAGRNARDAANFDARMTAATGGLQFGRDLLQAGYTYNQFGDAPSKTKYVKPPAGKNMSNPRDR